MTRAIEILDIDDYKILNMAYLQAMFAMFYQCNSWEWLSYSISICNLVAKMSKTLCNPSIVLVRTASMIIKVYCIYCRHCKINCDKSIVNIACETIQDLVLYTMFTFYIAKKYPTIKNYFWIYLIKQVFA
jgi:hypothetical protein